MLLRWWAEAPANDELTHWAADGIRRLLGPDDQQYVLPAVVAGQYPDLECGLAAHGLKRRAAKNASDAGVGVLRQCDEIVPLIAGALQEHARQSPPTIAEMNALSPDAPGWLYVRQAKGEQRFEQAQHWAARILALRGRSLDDAAEGMSSSEPQASETGCVADTWPNLFSRRAADLADPVALSLASSLQDWETHPLDVQIDVAAHLGKYLVREFLERQRTNRSKWPTHRLLSDLNRIADATWERRLNAWTASVLSRGFDITPNRWVRMCALYLQLSPTDDAERPWMADLPEISEMRRAIAQSTQAELVIHRLSSIDGEAQTGPTPAETVAAFERMIELLRKSRWTEPPEPAKRQIVDRTNLTHRPAIFRIDLLLCGSRPLGTPDALELGAWVTRASRRLDRWGLGCRIGSVSVFA